MVTTPSTSTSLITNFSYHGHHLRTITHYHLRRTAGTYISAPMLSRLALPRSCLLSRIAVQARLNSSVVPRPSHPSYESNHPVDSDCIPLTGPYSINDVLAGSSGTGLLPEETLRKLHKLAGLPYPSCSADEVAELVRVVGGVRSEKIKELLEQANRDFGEVGSEWGKRTVSFDGEENEGRQGEPEDSVAHGTELMKDSQRTSGSFYVVGRRRH